MAELQERSSSPDDSSSIVSTADVLQEVTTLQLVAVATACLTCDKAKQHVSSHHARVYWETHDIPCKSCVLLC